MEQFRYFIEPESEIDPKKRQPASYIRKAFAVDKEVKRAALYMTALGVYRGWLNGQALDAQLLLPGYTDYRYRLQVQSYDVTERLQPGENVLAAMLGDGWYRGYLSIGSTPNVYGKKTAFLCVLQIEYADGSCAEIHTDESWKATQNGPLRENDLKVREQYDARMELAGWNAPGFSDADWHGVYPAQYEGQLVPHEGEPILAQESFAPTVLQTPDGGTVLDFGQNMAGQVHFNVSGKAGHTVKLILGEVLDENGSFTQKNLVAEGASFISGQLGQELCYTLKEGTQSYQPFGLVSGFRYAKLENWPEPAAAENFRAVAVYSGLRPAGSFECSNPLLNQLVHNVQWSQRSNFVDIPTDCPTRERSGWTADISVFSETACYLTDPRKFLLKWLHDFMLDQSEDGSLAFIVPGGGKGAWRRSCCAWSDAIANIPTVLYQFYGDAEILRECYGAVKRYIDFNLRRARKKNLLLLFKTGRHRKYIIETGFHFGEWLEPGTAMYRDFIKDIFLPDTEVNTAWFYQTVSQAAQMAEVLALDEEAEYYRALAAQIKAAYRKAFTRDGRIDEKRHCRYVRPVAMDLLTEDEKKETVAALNQKCIDNDYRIGTGFLTTYRLLYVLSRYGCTDTAYRLLENTKQPGWLYAVTKGATTTWENWYGIKEDGVPVDSHNHYAPGSVAAWLFSDCAGIRPLEPGFAKIQIQPALGGSLTYAKASYESCQGRITSAWRIADGRFYLETTVPCAAQVVLPNGETHEVAAGTHSFECAFA